MNPTCESKTICFNMILIGLLIISAILSILIGIEDLRQHPSLVMLFIITILIFVVGMYLHWSTTKQPVISRVIPYGDGWDFKVINKHKKVKRGGNLNIQYHIVKTQSAQETTYRTLVCKNTHYEIVRILDNIKKNIPLGDHEGRMNNLIIPSDAPKGRAYVRYLITYENGKNVGAQTEDFEIV